MKRKRILFIFHLPPPLHGASLSNFNLINSDFLQTNFEIDSVNFQFAKTVKEIQKFSLLKIFKSIYYAFQIIIKIIRNRPGLVYLTLSPFGYAFYRDALYVLILKMFRLKIVYHLHGKGIKNSTSTSRIKKRIYKIIFKNCEVICLTNYLIKDIENISSAVPYIVPYGIPLQSKNFTKEIPTNNECVQILFLSNYIQTKGILLLVDALQLLYERGYFFKARLVGAPADLSIEDVQNYVNNKRMGSCIKVVGPKFNKEKYFEFENTDIFVFPTFYSNETFGIVNLEAMQYSLPIITTKEGGIPEIVIDNETGFIIEPQNVTQLSEKIAELIDNKELRIEMGKKGYERFINNYTLRHFEVNMFNTFQAILKSK